MRLPVMLLFNLLITVAHAQLPELTSSDKASPIVLQKLEVAVKIIGTRSSTTFTMTFHNPSEKTLEGTFLLPLPEGANVIHYALDINGRMRDAVPVEKTKATEVFESVQKRRIDPGLLEKTEGNVFRTRIFPFAAHGQRSISITYENDLSLSSSSELLYHLPLTTKDVVSKFALSVDVQERDHAPIFESTPIGPLKLLLDKGRYCTYVERQNIKLGGPLSIRITKLSKEIESFVQKRNGEYFFYLQSFLPPSGREKRLPKKLTVIWDNSLSGIYRNTPKESELLKTYLERLGTATVKLYTINNSFVYAGEFIVRNGKSVALKGKLNAMVYDGGTDYSKIRLEDTDETIFFSDGLSTLSEMSKLSSRHVIYTVNSSPKADYGILKAMSERNGGSFIDLQRRSIHDALQGLLKQPLLFLGIKENKAIVEHYPNVATPVQTSFSMAGKLTSRSATITLQFGYGQKVEFEKIVQMQYDEYEVEQWDFSKLFAQKKIEELDKEYERNKDHILLLGKQYSIATRNTSLLVLEDVMDYVRHEIGPPLELRSEYKRLLKQMAEDLSQNRKSILENAIDYSNDLQEWWNTSYPVKEKRTSKLAPPAVVIDSEAEDENKVYNTTSAAPPGPSPQQEQLREIQIQNLEGAKDEDVTVGRSLTGSLAQRELNEVAVSGYGTALQGKVSGVTITPSGQASTPNGNALLIVDGRIAVVMPPEEKIETIEALAPNVSVALYGSRGINGVMLVTTKERKGEDPKIHLEERTTSASYLKVLAKTVPSQRYQTYLQLRDKNLLNPTFYYDVASFFLKEDRALGLQILTNLGELDYQNHELYKLFGFKLKELGEKELALYIFKKVLLWRPHEPQSYRDYALALADCKKFQAALDTLYLVLTKEYNTDVMGDFDGIEETIVTEIAHLITKHKSTLNTAPITKELIQDMPVDIRVVMNWNMNDVDIDLWVTDPAGEKCFYSNSQTKIGGRLSEDFTQGYGPEQFLIKKAVKGKYKIQVHYYGENGVKIAGKTTLLVEVYTNYGRGNEQRKLITLQLEGEEREGVYVGEFVF